MLRSATSRPPPPRAKRSPRRRAERVPDEAADHSGHTRRGAKRKDCHERALGLLAVHARSRRELERRLVQAGFGAEEVAGELDRLELVGLVDDEAFARQVAEQGFRSRKQGRRVVAGALAAKGVAPSVAAAVIGELAGDEDARAAELAGVRAPRLAALPPDKAFQRLYGFLVRRGHAHDVARRAARHALAIETHED